MPHDWFVPLTHFFFACQMFVHHISVMNSSPQLGASLLSFGPGKADGISQFHGTDYDHQCTRPSDIRFSNSFLHMRFNYFFLTAMSSSSHFTSISPVKGCQQTTNQRWGALSSIRSADQLVKLPCEAAISGCQRSEFFSLVFAESRWQSQVWFVAFASRPWLPYGRSRTFSHARLWEAS